jgi:hypothetical protein
LLTLCTLLFTITLSVRFLKSLNAIEDQSSWAAALPKPAAGERENLLLYCISDRGKDSLVTALSVASYNTKTNDIRAIHLPTDTLLEVNGQGFMPLSHVYSAGGRELLAASVSDLLGLSIHTYLEIDEEILPFAVDKVGVSTLPSGLNVNNGSDVLSLIHASGLSSAESLERRREVITAITARVLDAGFPGKLQSFVAVSPLVHTNISWRKLLSMMDSFRSSAYQEAVSILDLPGKQEVQASGTYWLADMPAVSELVIWLKSDSATLPRGQISVEVLNGTGVPGAATSLADKLKQKGFAVISIGNADHFDYEISQVISRRDLMDAAREVAVLVPHAELLKEERPEADVIVTVIVGKNYTQE